MATKEKASKAALEPQEEPQAVERVVTPPQPAKAAESVYSAAELAANHKAFRTSREIVIVALRLAGKEAATFAEAKSIIEKFKTKEVK